MSPVIPLVTGCKDLDSGAAGTHISNPTLLTLAPLSLSSNVLRPPPPTACPSTPAHRLAHSLAFPLSTPPPALPHADLGFVTLVMLFRTTFTDPGVIPRTNSMEGEHMLEREGGSAPRVRDAVASLPSLVVYSQTCDFKHSATNTFVCFQFDICDADCPFVVFRCETC